MAYFLPLCQNLVDQILVTHLEYVFSSGFGS
jgi:hypothetical protein